MRKYTVKQIATVDEKYHQEAGSFYIIHKKKPIIKFIDPDMASDVCEFLNSR